MNTCKHVYKPKVSGSELSSEECNEIVYYTMDIFQNSKCSEVTLPNSVVQNYAWARRSVKGKILNAYSCDAEILLKGKYPCIINISLPYIGKLFKIDTICTLKFLFSDIGIQRSLTEEMAFAKKAIEVVIEVKKVALVASLMV